MDPPATIYMGKDKYESKYTIDPPPPHFVARQSIRINCISDMDEELIKYGWENDVWFHVDKLSSAHVYLRLAKGQTWDAIPEDLLIDLAQLTKANSIEGNTKDNLTIIYTPWSNLKKTPGMETGQVTFHKNNIVKRIHIEKRTNEIVNRLNKTRVEKYPELAEERIQHQREIRLSEKKNEKQARATHDEYIKEKRKEKELHDYNLVLKEDHMYSNKAMSGGRSVQEIEDDFM
ncbi:hypothetical protein BSLG_002784 [Batrachochytrium salamandrivorans]|nr:hypothetical protein BSLG_002784 [Batrachochytrium salamandrivorans]